jgi:hypothetical protein
MHYRQRIRDAVAQRLLAANTLAGTNVFTSRARPVLEILQRQQMVLSVYTSDESSTDSPDGYNRVRTLTVSIEGMAGGGDDLDDVLDNLAEQVEAAIDDDDTLGTLLTEPMELQSTVSEITARGNQQVGAFRMDFSCDYMTAAASATATEDALWPERPLPTEITTNLVPTPDAYVPVIGGIRPATIEHHIVSPARPLISDEPACADGTCAVPAWTGDPK